MASPDGGVGSTSVLEFWFDFASPYAHLAAHRIESLSDAAGVVVAWRPFVLGAIFSAQGWATSPFVVYLAKGRHMWRDVERRAAAYGTSVRPPRPFPQNSVHAHRLALVGLEEGWGTRFVTKVFAAQFVDGADIASPAFLERCVVDAGGDPGNASERSTSAAIRAALRTQTERAVANGIFGAPSFVVADELFWGDDRLEEALLWACGRHPMQSV